jgi:DNA-binding GntR family transcriptional regulator
MRDTIDMAREAGIDAWWDSGSDWRETFNEHLKVFEALIRADEREALAVLETDAHYIFNNPPGETSQDVRDVIEWYSAAIRARGNT